MKKILALFLVLTLTLGFGVAMAEEQPLVGISCPFNPTGWVAAVSWSAETTANSLGMNYLMKIAESEAEQASDLDFFINEGCEIIVLFPFNDTLEAAAQRVMDAGITLVNFDRTLGGTTPDYYLAGDNYQIGVLGAQYIAEKLGGKGKIVITTIPSYGAIFEERVNGCRDGLKEFPEIEVLGEYAADNAAQETGLALMTDILTANPELDGVYSCDDELSTGMLKAIEEQGRLGEVKVMTGCGDGQAYFKLMDEYKDKIWLSTQTYAPYMMGDCIKLAYGLTQGETYDARVIIPPETLDYTNYADWMVRNGVTEDAPF
ncbi:MAG: substrate-binding domain-containing protein [Candidatus Excrementavichristensenella sp.]|jgi:ribose transport system substrate-binding protein